MILDALSREIHLDFLEKMPTKIGLRQSMSASAPQRMDSATARRAHSGLGLGVAEEMGFSATVSSARPQLPEAAATGAEHALSELSGLIAGLTGRRVAAGHTGGSIESAASAAQQGDLIYCYVVYTNLWMVCSKYE